LAIYMFWPGLGGGGGSTYAIGYTKWAGGGRVPGLGFRLLLCIGLFYSATASMISPPLQPASI
jgi:hypothetical protein